MTEITDIDAIIAPGKFPGFWGWHDDHREQDGKPGYAPALMQVRAEFAELLDVINAMPNRRCGLQLGLGNCRASHVVWSAIFLQAVTVDRGISLMDDIAAPGMDTHDEAALRWAKQFAPYDFLFIDAGHDYADVDRDMHDYGLLVRPGGIIAFHDTLPRSAYPEVEVWRYIETLKDVTTIGTEVGISWLKV